MLSVLPYINCYVVCDTGSTDDTVEMIERVLADLPGEVHSIVFRDFGQARNEALEQARRSALEFDYLLLIDADMELVVSLSHFHESLTHDGYLVRQVSGGVAYQNVRLLARQAPARYVGLTHEYLDVGSPVERLEGLHMLDHACGSNRTEKTERDLALLGLALEENPDDTRSLFYLAQTLREADRHPEAIAAYQRRVALGGWEEEVWYSQFMIARCHQGSGDPANFVASCLQAYQLRPSRAEPLHALAQHYRNHGCYETSALFCEAGSRIPLPEDLLFVEDEVYRTGFRHELSISGYYCRTSDRQTKACQYARELAIERGASPWVRDNARANWKHFALSAIEMFPSVRFLPIEQPLPAGYHPCNPSLAVRDGTLWCVLRSVNYSIKDDGLYRVDGDGVIRTCNYLLRLDEALKIVSSAPVFEEPPRFEHPVIDGLEDIRLILHGEGFRGSATIVDVTPDYLRRIAVFDLSDDGQVKNLTLQAYEPDHHQKNWVPFVDQGQLGFIYWTDPTIVLRWDEQSRQSEPWLRHACSLALENLRGSSGAIVFDGGWLFVAHEVSHVEGKPTYLHRFVQLNSDFQVRAVTEPFYFQKVGIEFCCGLVQSPAQGELILSFGIDDAQAWLATLQAEDVRRQLRSAATP